MRRSSAALAVSLLVLSLDARADDATRVDGLAAVIGGQAPGPLVDIILRSDVELRGRLLLLSRGALPADLAAIPPAVLSAVLSEIIGEHLIAREARRVQAATPSAADVEQEHQRLLKAAGGKERLRATLALLSATDEELYVIARRRALVGAFLSANLEGALVVTDAEVQRAYEAQDQTTGAEQPAMPSELRARLSREAFDRSVARWVTVLRARTPLRMYVNY